MSVLAAATGGGTHDPIGAAPPNGATVEVGPHLHAFDSSGSTTLTRFTELAIVVF
jgi:hypothetical protein